VPAGVWPTAKVHLRSNVNLHLEDGAVLLFSADPADYLPAVQTTWEGMECFNYSPLVYAFECTNVAITGEGTLRAKLDVWKIWYKRPPAHMAALARLYEMASHDVPVADRHMVGDDANLRPQFIQFNRCENVLLEGVTIEDSPFWVIHPFLSRHVTIRDVTVRAYGHNNDGVDPEMSQNVLIENCVFDQGDDAIAIKSGRNRDAWRLDTPSRNIVVRNCEIRNGHQLLAIGSELSGGVENVLVENCTVDPAITTVGHLLFIKTNERRGGYVRNIHLRNITAGAMRYGVLGIETDVLYQWRDLVPTYERRLTPFDGVHLENVSVTEATFIARIQGQAEQPVGHVELTNVTAESVRKERYLIKNVADFVVR
jgi:polygalacturonase